MRLERTLSVVLVSCGLLSLRAAALTPSQWAGQLVVGACCALDNQCLTLSSTPDTCYAQHHGVFAGPNTACSACAVPRPCCVHNDGDARPACAKVTPAECNTYGGVRVASCTSMTECAPASSASARVPRQPELATTRGACCANAACIETADRTHCTELGGFFYGQYTRCMDAKVQCGGGCCHHTTGCRLVHSAAACDHPTDEAYLGDGVGCSENSCSGACCAPGGVCTTTESPADCSSVWAGFGSSCASCAALPAEGLSVRVSSVDTVDTIDVPPQTPVPTGKPTQQPTSEPTQQPTGKPTQQPTSEPTQQPTGKPTQQPTSEPTQQPTGKPVQQLTSEPTHEPTGMPSQHPTSEPTQRLAVKPATIPPLTVSSAASVNRPLPVSVSPNHIPSSPQSTDDLIGACCSPTSECSEQSIVDCASSNGFFRGSNSTCADDNVCARCLPCILDDDETAHCMLRQYNSLDGHGHASHHASSHGYNHAHGVHHRNDACESPQLCASNYGRCFVQAVRRRDVSDNYQPFVCGGIDAETLACAVEYMDGTGRCGVGVCERDPQFGASGLTICTNIREYPCSCRCYDAASSELVCGEATGTAYVDYNRNVAADSGEPPLAGVTVGIWLDNSAFTLPPSTPPLAIRITDELGNYVFDDLPAARYHVIPIGVPSTNYSLAVAPTMQTFTVQCPSFSHSNSDDDDSSSSSSSSAMSHREMISRKSFAAGGDLSSVSSAMHVARSLDFFVSALYAVSGRVLVDSNPKNVADDGLSAEAGIGGALIRARLEPSMDIVRTALSSPVDGTWRMDSLPPGLYTFDELDAPGYTSTGDSAAPNDNLVPHVLIEHFVNVSGVSFFDRLEHDDEHGPRHNHGDTHGRSACARSWLSSECIDHSLTHHTGLIVLLLLACLSLCVSFYVCCLYTACGNLFAQRRKRPTTSTPTTPTVRPQTGPPPTTDGGLSLPTADLYHPTLANSMFAKKHLL